MKPHHWIMLFLLFIAFPAFVSAEEKLDEGLINPGFHEPPAWFKNSFLSLREDIEEATADGRRLVLYFYQDGCPYCKKLLEINFAQKNIVDTARANFDVVAINIWGDREVTDMDGSHLPEKRFAENLRVMFTPTLLFFNEKGEVVLRINGYYPPHKFKTALEYVAGRHESGGRFRDYLSQHAPLAATGKLHHQPYFMQPPYELDSRRRAGRHLLVLFEQKECPACDELHNDILRRDDSKSLMALFDVVQLDMWSKTPVTTPGGQNTVAASWAEALGVKYAPSFVFFDPSGKEVFRAEAYLKAFHIQSVLDYVGSKSYLRQPHFQRFIEERADRLRDQGISVELMR